MDFSRIAKHVEITGNSVSFVVLSVQKTIKPPLDYPYDLAKMGDP